MFWKKKNKNKTSTITSKTSLNLNSPLSEEELAALKIQQLSKRNKKLILFTALTPPEKELYRIIKKLSPTTIKELAEETNHPKEKIKEKINTLQNIGLIHSKKDIITDKL